MNKLFGTVICALISLSTSAQAGTTSAEWRGSRCFEITPDGNVVMELSKSVCRRDLPTKAKWNGGRCFEYTPAGNAVMELSIDLCRKAAPTEAKWSGGRCFEYTSSGNAVMELSIDLCRKAAPTEAKWSGGRCFEYTPAGNAVMELSVSVCRNGAGSASLDPNALVAQPSVAPSEAAVISDHAGRGKVIPQSSTPEQPGSATSMTVQ